MKEYVELLCKGCGAVRVEEAAAVDIAGFLRAAIAEGWRGIDEFCAERHSDYCAHRARFATRRPVRPLEAELFALDGICAECVGRIKQLREDNGAED